MADPIVIVDAKGIEHEFPAGFDPKRAAEIVRSQSTTPVAPSPQPRSLADELAKVQQSEDLRTQEGRDFLIGAARSVPGTVAGIGKLFGVNMPFSEHLATAANPMQAHGKTAGNIAQFFLPGPSLSKAKAAVATGKGFLDAVIGLGIEGGSAAAVQSAQQGTTRGAGTTALATAATGGVMQGAMNGLGILGERIEAALLKPTTAASEGLTPSELVKNVYKYDVGGTLGQSYDKVQAKISGLTKNLRAILNKNPSASVDLADVYDKTLKDYVGNPQADAAIGRILEKVKFGLNEHGIPMEGGILDLADANVAKQAVGEMGAWLHNVKGQVVSDADQIAEKVANTFYGHLKTAIEAKAQGPVKAINRAIADLIPIKTAIIRRIPIEERANVMSIADIVGLSAHTLGLSLASRALKSGMTANAMVKAAEYGQPIASAAARGAGATSASTRTAPPPTTGR